MNFSSLKRTTMAGFSLKSRHYHVRSVSFPARSHPTTVRIEQELNKLKSWLAESPPKAETLNACISSLVELHQRVEHLLSLPLTQQALTQHHQKWVNDMLEESVRSIDVCNDTRDTVLLVKEGLQHLQSSLRRSNGNVAVVEGEVNSYQSSRKKMKKEVAKSLAELKQSSNFNSDNHQLVRVLREASSVTISVFQSLLLFLSAPVGKQRAATKWPLVSRLVQKGAVMGGHNGELEEVEIAVSNLTFCGDFGHVNGKLEGLSLGIEGIESGLECLFRNLIRTRVALLNILSR